MSSFCSKNINVFEITLATTVNKFVINKLVKLKMLYTTGSGIIWLKKTSFLELCLHGSHVNPTESIMIMTHMYSTSIGQVLL